MSQQLYKPVILITGCSSGIGLSLAKKISQIPEYRMVVTARQKSIHKIFEAGLIETDNIMIAPLDVSVGTERRKLISEINQKWGGVDILVNNAGISYRAVVEHMGETDELAQLRTNYLGPMALTRLVLPNMRAKGRGKIINVSSVSGMLAMPTMSSYSASKFALEGASESLWYEMRPLGINVSLVQPGFVRSASFQNVYYPEASQQAEREGGVYSDYYRNMAPFIAKMMNNSFTTADDVAKTIVKVIRMQRPPLRVPATYDAFFFYYLRRLLPRRFFHTLLFLLLPNAKHWARDYTRARTPTHE